MRNIDLVRPYGHALYLHFAGTGETRSASTLQLDQGLTVAREGVDLVGRYHSGPSSFVIERFATETLANNGLALVDDAIARFAKHQRLIRKAKAFVRWCLGPVIALMFGLAINAAATKQYAAAGDAANSVPPSSQSPAAVASPSATAPLPQPPVAEVAKGMADAVKDGRFTVRLSSGDKGTFYVFSDPSCPHCRDFESQMNVLAKSYTIHVLPVSVVGGAASSGRIAQLLCQPVSTRPSVWRRLIEGSGLVDLPQCPEGSAASTADDRIFHALGLAGTPSVVAADGRILPPSVPLNAESIDSWMQQAAR